MQDEIKPTDSDSHSDMRRRDFLDRAGRFAVVTPPAITMLLSTTLSSGAIAGSGGGRTRPGRGGPPPGRGPGRGRGPR